MSLYGTGRTEGVIAVCVIGALTVAAHVLATLRDGLSEHVVDLATIAGAIGGMLMYRFLRAQGRSRYAGFLGGIAYGMSPMFAGLADSPRELLAAALVPIALEAARQCDRPTKRDLWVPFAGLCIALPSVFGVTVIGMLTTTLALAMLTATMLRRSSDIDIVPVGKILATIALGAMACTNLLWLDPLAGWLGPQQPAVLQNVLSSRTPNVITPMLAVRVLSPFLVWFALLGMLRRQRQVHTARWLVLLVLGTLPAIWLTIPSGAASMPNLFTTWALPAVAWWLSVLAITVLGAAGLDDWLDQPQRRRGAHLSLLLLTLFAAPALPLLGSTNNPLHLATVLGTFGLLVLSTVWWRRLGVLRFKNVLSAVGMLAFTIPVVLQMQPKSIFAVPLAEGLATSSWQRVSEQLAAHPWYHFAGIASAVLLALAGTLVGGLCTAHATRRSALKGQ